MRVVRQITYEGTKEQLEHQLSHSLGIGVHKVGDLTITISDFQSDFENGKHPVGIRLSEDIEPKPELD